MKAVYVGCGEDRRAGFIHCDIRALPGVDIVCRAWELSESMHDADMIYSRHMLEHLTCMEADAALADWLQALRPGGQIEIWVPNMDFHIQQWQNAVWDDENLARPDSDARHALAGFWGWQRQCRPHRDDYETSYWDVHKSGYNVPRLTFLLSRQGYQNIRLQVIEKMHLQAKACAPL
ncbi:class I SAM-dependent methyltransferase [Celerinatantimonas sp. YJH-8]|uniref:class I SAM-dependent methyltransferase n=1 Tax=Celerinatantimonas sp. YJH-8 TaxID=3228714 RepID=UPI0038C9758C